MNNVLIFAGTTEGRELAEAVKKWDKKDRTFFVCVATEHGRQLLPENDHRMQVLAQRLAPEQMKALMETKGINVVIDATHPYAALVSANIKGASEQAGVTYVRLLRRETKIEDRYLTVPDTKAAVQYLKTVSGNVLLTTGSKELSLFTEIENFQSRLFARILPTPEMVQRAFDLGFDAGHLICMQGPFSHESNVALMRQTGVSYLVTKESGRAGGFEAKLTAADEAGVKVIIIGRPSHETGLSLEEVLKLLDIASPLQENKKEDLQWFPQFINIKGKRILIVGAGKIASRRLRTLSRFDAEIIVTAPEMSELALELEKKSRILLKKKVFEERDLEGMDMVLAATNDRGLNQRIGRLCRERGIPVNVADKKEECDFYFPAVIAEGDLTVGVTAGGKNHSLAVKGKKILSEALNRELYK